MTKHPPESWEAILAELLEIKAKVTPIAKPEPKPEPPPKREQTQAEIEVSLIKQKQSKVAPGDELGMRRAIRTAQRQSEVLAGVAHLLRKVPDDQ